MNTVCENNKCTGCMACMDVCPKNAIKIKDTLSTYNAVINEELCIQCGACSHVCQNVDSRIEFKKSISWYQGWSNDENRRKTSSSGAAAYELACAMINRGGCVFSCLFSNGEFLFEEANSFNDLGKFAGSKYVKSNPTGMYRNIRKRLNEDRDVLFIGLPCQVAALKQYVGEHNKLYTVDLICHGTPSPKTLDIFLKQYGFGLDSLKDIQFRVKDKFQVAQEDQSFSTEGTRDPYMIAFLNGLIYTENCYECKYARRERVSDITIGDSWCSELPTEEQKRGISLLLAQTKKGEVLIKDANLKLSSVDLEKAIESNHQLQHPSIEPTGRTRFFNGLQKNVKFNSLVRRCYPKQYIKQRIKGVLLGLGIVFLGGGN